MFPAGLRSDSAESGRFTTQRLNFLELKTASRIRVASSSDPTKFLKKTISCLGKADFVFDGNIGSK